MCHFYLVFILLLLGSHQCDWRVKNIMRDDLPFSASDLYLPVV